MDDGRTWAGGGRHQHVMVAAWIAVLSITVFGATTCMMAPSNAQPLPDPVCVYGLAGCATKW